MARTESQKKAKELLYKLPCIYTVKLGTKLAAEQKCKIGNDVYVNVTSLNSWGCLERLKTYAKNHGWKQSDLFPAYVSGDNYDAVTYLVRIGAILEDRQGAVAAIIGKEDELGSHKKEYLDRVIALATAPFVDTGKGILEGVNKARTEEQFADAHRIWAERIRLLNSKEADKPDIQTCIQVLKQAGYKVMKPVTQYEEI